MKNPFALIILMVGAVVFGTLVFRVLSPPTIGVQSDSEFRALVASSDRPVLVDFYADWCGPCKALEPILADVEKEYEDRIQVVRINGDHHAALTREFRVSGYPTLMLFYDGKPIARLSGLRPKPALVQWLDSYLPENLH